MLSATPFLWLQHPVDDAVHFYAHVLDAEVLAEDYGPAMQLAKIRVAGQTLHLFNAGEFQELTQAFSLLVTCSTQAELDRIWAGLENGGAPMQCGWITDRFGITWQIIPERLDEWLADPHRGQQVTEAMLTMVKLDIAALESALRGD